MSDRIVFVHCSNCSRVFDQRGSFDFCSKECERLFYAKVRQCSLKDKPQVDLSNGEKVLRKIREMRYLT